MYNEQKEQWERLPQTCSQKVLAVQQVIALRAQGVLAFYQDTRCELEITQDEIDDPQTMKEVIARWKTWQAKKTAKPATAIGLQEEEREGTEHRIA